MIIIMIIIIRNAMAFEEFLNRFRDRSLEIRVAMADVRTMNIIMNIIIISRQVD